MIFDTMTGILLFLIICIIFLILVYTARLRRLKVLAASDPVTNAYNREGFSRTISKYISGQYSQYALVVMNIKNFRHIRQTFGADNGNRVLVHLYKTLSSSLSNAEPAARIGGGTFCFLLKTRRDDAVRARLNRIAESANLFNKQLPIPYHIELCFGVYVLNSAAESPDTILDKAAQAAEQCREHTLICFYSPTPGELDMHKWEKAEQMVHSMQSGDFVVYMQPKIRLGDSRIVGAEALVRWRHPQRGLLAPEMFIPLLKEYHLLHRLDLYLFEAVCQKLAAWKQAGLEPCPVSVNITCEPPKIDAYLETCLRLVQKYDIKPELIEFELDMDAQYESISKLQELISNIHSCGFQCSLDHFGSRTIPMHLLRELDADTIKLDRSLFSSENNSRRNRYVVESILKTATQMQINTVAEGIDNASQVQYLQHAGCDMVQGFFYFRPMPMDEFQKTVFQNGDLRYVGAVNTADSVQTVIPAALQQTANNSIVMFSFLTREDRIIFSSIFTPLMNGQTDISNAMSLFSHSSLIHENDRKDFFHLLERCRKEEGWVENALRFYTSEGRYEWLELHLHKEFSPTNGDMVISGTLVNIAQWKKEVKRWKEKANRDALTGLYNREYFEHFASTTLNGGTAMTGALVFLDVDDFKKVNDTLGHMAGDDVLRFIARRLLGVFRHTDVVGRYAGDEFIVYVNGINRTNLEARLTQLCESFRLPYRSENIEYMVSISIGASMFPEDGSTYPELLSYADSAAYFAKRNGKNQFVFYQTGMEEAVCSEKNE